VWGFAAPKVAAAPAAGHLQQFYLTANSSVVVLHSKRKEPAMTSRQVRFALPLLIAFLTILPGCQENHPVGLVGSLTIKLANNNGQCTQNDSTGVIDVEQDQDVTYELAASSANPEFNVQFSTCPFASGKCPANSPQGTSDDMGTPTAASVNNTYYYSSVTINGQSCNNGTNTFGVHIKPGNPLKKKK
jgi:hypothetical protein